MEAMGKKRGKLISAVVLFVLVLAMTAQFHTNFLMPAQNPLFNPFQADSEDIVIDKILQDRFDTQKPEDAGYGLGTYHNSMGFQGHVFSFLYNTLGLHNFDLLNLLCCVALALTLVGISHSLSKLYSLLLGLVFYAATLLSPWVTAMARNLYWVEYLLFLPALFSMLTVLWVKEGKPYWWCGVLLTFLGSWAKSLSGYEFLSSVLMFAVAFPCAAFLCEKEKAAKKRWFWVTAMLAGALLLGFAAALIPHALLRGNGSVATGLMQIWQQDFRRRALGGDVGNFESVYHPSLLASPLDVLYMYFYNYYPNVVLGIAGELFPALVLLSVCVLIRRSVSEKRLVTQRNCLWLLLFLSPLSWFILGKSHSYIHTHINFVVWYIGFVPYCLYVIAEEILSFVKAGPLRDKLKSGIPAWSAKQLLAVCLAVPAILGLSMASQKIVTAWNEASKLDKLATAGSLLYEEKGVQIYRYDNALYYVMDRDTFRNEVILLHIYPAAKDDVLKENQARGIEFNGYSFAYRERRIRLPFWAAETKDVMKIGLPAYEIGTVYTGQRDLWETTF